MLAGLLCNKSQYDTMVSVVMYHPAFYLHSTVTNRTGISNVAL